MARVKKKGTSFLVILFRIILLILSPIIIYIGYYIYKEFNVGLIHYREFGIRIPTGYKIHGVDISHHNGIINWSALTKMKVEKIQMGFAFIKATEGRRMIDSKFYQNWLRAHQEGITCGAYHFFRPELSAQKQADHFISIVNLKSGDLPPVLDIEETNGVSKAAIQKGVKDWLDIIERHYGVTPILYTGAVFYKNYLGKKFDKYPLWVAHYHSGNSPRIGRKWHFWQHSEEGNINGVKHKVDFNVFNGNSQDFSKLLKQ